MRIVITSLPDIVNLRLLLPRNDFWLRRRILSRIRRRDSRSLQFYWWESLLGLLFVFNALKIQTSLLTPTSFCPFSYVELTFKWEPWDNTPVSLLSILLLSEAAISKEKNSIKPSKNLPGKGKARLGGSMDSNFTWSSMTRGNYLIFFLLRAAWMTERPWNTWTSINESLASSSETGGISRKISSNNSLLTESTLLHA